MSIISTFCKKGGVGKTTFIAYLGHYLATQGKKVLILSVDDQNSVFKVFGVQDKIFDANDNYLEFLIAGHVDLGDILIEARENLYLIKTLNTDKLSLKLTLERSQEKKLQYILSEYASYFDYILIDFPPSSSRITEVLLDVSNHIMIVVGLDALGLGGFINTIQYFIDNEIDLKGIKYIIPNGYSKNRRAPRISLEQLQSQAVDFTPHAEVVEALAERSIIKNLQAEGISPFDSDENTVLTSYDLANKQSLKEDLTQLFTTLSID